MKVLFDTSVLVAAMISAHPNHEAAFPWLNKALAGELDGYAATHTLAELYAVLSSLPVRPRLKPPTVERLIKSNVVKGMTIVETGTKEYLAVIERLATFGISGGATYDAIIGAAAVKSEVDTLLTFNVDDFSRVLPGWSGEIISPAIEGPPERGAFLT